jgi:hypothetical protein
MADRALVTSWAVCGIAAAAARFVPVPLLDDVIRERAARTAVLRTVRAHGRALQPEVLAPLWGDDEPHSRSSRLSRRLRTLPRRLLLFPVRKYAALFGAVRGVPTDLMRVVLLARTVDRLLARGALDGGSADESRTVRAAVDAALESIDLRLLAAGLSDGLSGVRGLSAAAVSLARRRFADPDDAEPRPEEPDEADEPVAQGASAVTEVLDRPEIQELLERFDAAVDARLAG